MYIGIEQIDESLRKLDSVHTFIGTSFLAFKIVQLPIETSTHVDIAAQERFILDTYYNPYSESKYYYVPLRGGVAAEIDGYLKINTLLVDFRRCVPRLSVKYFYIHLTLMSGHGSQTMFCKS